MSGLALSTGKIQSRWRFQPRASSRCEYEARTCAAPEHRLSLGWEGTSQRPPRSPTHLKLSLWLVGELVSRWGVPRDPFRVWFEVDT